MKGIDTTARNLIHTIFTASELKRVSVYLESLTLSNGFKSRIKKIALNDQYTDAIKRNEMLKLFDKENQPSVHRFFEDMFKRGEFWLFASEHFDYFDQFVQSFQMLTEEVALVQLVTAIEIEEDDVQKMSQGLAQGMGKHVIIHIQVDPTIIAGAQIRMDNLVFDYSLKAKFNQFKRQWVSKLMKTSELTGRE